MATTVAVANQKGGVGKTTTAVNLAAALTTLGLRILLVDLDPQGNTTSSLGFDKGELERSAYDLLINGDSLDDVVTSIQRLELDLIGANPQLAGAEVELVGTRQRERRLRQALSDQAGAYDLVIIDCPPSLGLLTVNALTVAERIVIPIQCEYLALEGLMQLINTMDLVRRRLNPALDVLGVVMTMYDARTKLSAEVVESVRRHFPRRLFATVIPRSVRLAEAPSHGLTIFEYAPQSAGAVAYQDLAREVAARLDLATVDQQTGDATVAAPKSVGTGPSLEFGVAEAQRGHGS